MSPHVQHEIDKLINHAIDTDGRFLLRRRATAHGPDKWDFVWVVHTSPTSAHAYMCWWYDQPGELGYDKFRNWLAVQQDQHSPMTEYRMHVLWTWFKGLVEELHGSKR